MKIYRIIFLIAMATCNMIANAQNQSVKNDSVKMKLLDSIIVTTKLQNSRLPYLPDISGTNIFAGKKTEDILPTAAQANLAQNIARMAFAKVPGLVIWDMDGAGTQVNVGSRSTDSHRSIEMNMRQNGYNTNSDIFGYPEDHYTPPMQAIQEIQLVRGSAALQFGSQFGGMMNYIMKSGDSTKPLGVESEQTAGSNGFFNSYNAVGGTVGKLNYYVYVDDRHGDGWRPDAAFNYHAYYADLNYRFNKRGSIDLQFSRMDYVQQIAGGLIDAQFYANARQATRTRNFFSPEINIPALTFKYAFSKNTRLQVQSNVIFGQRNSVQFINTPNIKDTFNTAIGSYNPRQVDRDYYSGFTTEARLLHQYFIGHIHAVLATGLRYSTERTTRDQKGTGTTGSDFDLSLTKAYGIALGLHTNNYAAFAENIFQLTNNFSVTPGIRYEIIDSKMNGVINNAQTAVSYTGNRNFPLAGLGLQYDVKNTSQFYGNISQAYRPYLYASVTPATQVDQVDPNLKDSKGYDIDLGWRANFSDALKFDVSLYYLYYGNRVGLLSETNADGSSYLYSTNVGNSLAKGVEAYVELSLFKIFNINNRLADVRIFTSLAYDHARYISGILNKSGTNVSINGNYVENTPDWIDKTGLMFQYKTLSTSLQYSYNSTSYSDALNTISNTTGVIGLVPSWHVWDWAADYRFGKFYHISAGVNNLANVAYFNRRINMYPGPGILPADGRTFYISLGIKI